MSVSTVLRTRPVGLTGAVAALVAVAAVIDATVSHWVLIGLLASLAVIGSP